jgi:hypothetical protein
VSIFGSVFSLKFLNLDRSFSIMIITSGALSERNPDRDPIDVRSVGLVDFLQRPSVKVIRSPLFVPSF